jgi:hypothetical protein
METIKPLHETRAGAMIEIGILASHLGKPTPHGKTEICM